MYATNAEEVTHLEVMTGSFHWNGFKFSLNMNPSVIEDDVNTTKHLLNPLKSGIDIVLVSDTLENFPFEKISILYLSTTPTTK